MSRRIVAHSGINLALQCHNVVTQGARECARVRALSRPSRQQVSFEESTAFRHLTSAGYPPQWVGFVARRPLPAQACVIDNAYAILAVQLEVSEKSETCGAGDGTMKVQVELQDILATVQDDLVRVDARVRSAAEVEYPLLAAVVGDIIGGGGKRIRPALMLLVARALGHDLDRVILAAAASELLHTAGLVHDDLIDEAKVRRGKRTLNAVFDPGTVILVGDYLFAQAARTAAETGSTRVMDIFGRILAEITDGQLREILKAHDPDQTVEDYERRIYGKTASLFAGSAEIAAVLSDAPKERSRPRASMPPTSASPSRSWTMCSTSARRARRSASPPGPTCARAPSPCRCSLPRQWPRPRLGLAPAPRHRRQRSLRRRVRRRDRRFAPRRCAPQEPGRGDPLRRARQGGPRMPSPRAKSATPRRRWPTSSSSGTADQPAVKAGLSPESRLFPFRSRHGRAWPRRGDAPCAARVGTVPTSPSPPTFAHFFNNLSRSTSLHGSVKIAAQNTPLPRPGWGRVTDPPAWGRHPCQDPPPHRRPS